MSAHISEIEKQLSLRLNALKSLASHIQCIVINNELKSFHQYLESSSSSKLSRQTFPISIS